MIIVVPSSDRLTAWSSTLGPKSEITEEIALLAKSVDKFHYPDHKKTDKYCRENCNPNIELKKLGIKEINSPACEQAFKWINCFKNLKTMNQPRFKFFLLYMIDLHNLHIEGNISSLANPLNKDRIEMKVQEQRPINEIMCPEDIINDLEKMSLHSKVSWEEQKIVEVEVQKLKLELMIATQKTPQEHLNASFVQENIKERET